LTAKGARPQEVVDEVLDLFINLGATEEQIEFPVLYGSARAGALHPDLDQAERLLAAGKQDILPPAGGNIRLCTRAQR